MPEVSVIILDLHKLRRACLSVRHAIFADDIDLYMNSDYVRSMAQTLNAELIFFQSGLQSITRLLILQKLNLCFLYQSSLQSESMSSRSKFTRLTKCNKKNEVYLHNEISWNSILLTCIERCNVSYDLFGKARKFLTSVAYPTRVMSSLWCHHLGPMCMWLRMWCRVFRNKTFHVSSCSVRD